MRYIIHNIHIPHQTCLPSTELFWPARLTQAGRVDEAIFWFEVPWMNHRFCCTVTWQSELGWLIVYRAYRVIMGYHNLITTRSYLSVLAHVFLSAWSNYNMTASLLPTVILVTIHVLPLRKCSGPGLSLTQWPGIVTWHQLAEWNVVSFI